MRERPGGSATDREVVVVAAVLAAGSEKAAADRLGLSHSTVKHHLANARSKVGAETTAQLVWILAPRLPEPEGRDAGVRVAPTRGDSGPVADCDPAGEAALDPTPAVDSLKGDKVAQEGGRSDAAGKHSGRV